MKPTLPNRPPVGHRSGPRQASLRGAPKGLLFALLACACAPDSGAVTSCDGAGSPALVAPLGDRHPEVVAAVEAVRARVAARPDDGLAWGALGLTLHANGMLELGREGYAEASARSPEPARWYYLAARAARDLGLADEALRDARSALDHDPACAAADWVVGQHYLEEGRLATAREAFAAATAADPDNPGGWCGLARVALLEDRPAEALAILQRVLAATPTHAYANNLAALALRGLGRMDEALEFGRRGADGLPDWNGPWDRELRAARVPTGSLRWEVASELFDAGRVDEAIRLLEELRREEPDRRGLATFLARAYVRGGRLQDARLLFEETLAAEADHRDALVGLADVLVRLDELDRATELIDRALALHPDYGRAHHVHGVLLKRRGETAAAIDAFRLSLFHDERNPTTRLSIGALELELRRWMDARQTFEAALETGAPPAEALLGLAKACTKLGRLAEAEEALGRAAGAPDVDPRELERLRTELRRAQERGGS